MRRTVLAICLISVAFIGPSIDAAEPTAGEEAAIRARVESYVAAFNAGDAAEAAEHWSDNAEYVLPDSNQRIRGRKAIRTALEKLLAAEGQFQFTVSDQRIRCPTDSVAIEEGTARLVVAGQPPARASYTAIHVKKDGTWYRDSVRETLTPASPAAHEHLAALAWLTGTWKCSEENETLRIQCDWTHNKNFISRSFEINTGNGEKLSGTQMIGWDPTAGAIRSWAFDSEGGFEQAEWDRDGEVRKEIIGRRVERAVHVRDRIRELYYRQNHPFTYWWHYMWTNHPVWSWWRVTAPLRWADWSSVTGWCGYIGSYSEPVYYEYTDDGVYANGQEVQVDDGYSQQALELARSGAALLKQRVDAQEADKLEWLPLGVFSLSDSQDGDPTMFLQLAISREGIVAGSFANMTNNDNLSVQGGADRESTRLAVTIGDKEDVVIETGMYNLTENQSSALLHFEGGTIQNWTLVRMADPNGKQDGAK